MRAILMLLAGPLLGLCVIRLFGPFSPLPTVAAALGAQAVVLPLLSRRERRRAARELDTLRRRAGVAIVTVPLTPGAALIQWLIPVLIAGLLAVAALAAAGLTAAGLTAAGLTAR